MWEKIPTMESIFGVEEQREKTWAEECEDVVCEQCPKLTWQQRIGGCLCCLFLGFFISIGSTFRLIGLLQGNPTPFAVMYTTGNVISICSTCFLYGPWTQAKKMFEPTRAVATTIYIVMLGVTLFVAYTTADIPLRGFILVICIVCQFLALMWYTLSYIPFARELVYNCLKSTICSGLTKCCPEEESSSFPFTSGEI